jgi:hypothetical protein
MASAYNNIGQDELNNKFNFDAAFKVRARLGGRRGRSRIRTHLRPWRSRRLILCVRCDAGVSRGGQLGSGAIDVQLQPRARAAQDRARTQPATASSRLLAPHTIGAYTNATPSGHFSEVHACMQYCCAVRTVVPVSTIRPAHAFGPGRLCPLRPAAPMAWIDPFGLSPPADSSA